MSKMKKIIIAGYPKSGNTWLSRLTAALADCPVEGFLNSTHQEIAIEGTDRDSKLKLYKSHHQLHELSQEDIDSSKIIYVIRDPRDVAISGKTFFTVGARLYQMDESPKKRGPFEFLKLKLNMAYARSVDKLTMKKHMVKAVLHGNEIVHHWCRISWKAHMMPYFNNPEVLKVKYESLLSDPLTEAKRILEFMGITKDEATIIKDIESQSFKKKKEQFEKENQTSKADFLRKGSKEQWKKMLSDKENKVFVSQLRKELTDLGYDLVK